MDNLHGPPLALSVRPEFEKKQQYALELKVVDREEVTYLISNDVYQLNEWQFNLERAMLFSHWLKKLIAFVKANSEALTKDLRRQLNGILLFVQKFDASNNLVEIEYASSQPDGGQRLQRPVEEAKVSDDRQEPS